MELRVAVSIQVITIMHLAWYFWREKQCFIERFFIKIVKSKLLPKPDRPVAKGLCLYFSTRFSKFIMSFWTQK